MNELPWVSVVCLCYNHAPFVAGAIDSVLRQTYPRVQLIVVDDGSTDGSVDAIQGTLRGRPEIVFLPLSQNQGNCQAFNKGLALTTGDFIIDLAADDLLQPDRIEKGVFKFNTLGPDYGVQFSDAELIDESGNSMGYHSDRFPHSSIPQGDVYQALIVRYFINSPTMMIRRSVLEKMGGYDESLAYEDFDFWIRSSRVWKYSYSAEPLVKRRIVPNSMSQNQYKRNSVQLRSTYRVCEKIMVLNRNAEEVAALSARIRYEMKRAVRLAEWVLAFRYFKLLLKNSS